MIFLPTEIPALKILLLTSVRKLDWLILSTNKTKSTGTYSSLYSVFTSVECILPYCISQLLQLVETEYFLSEGVNCEPREASVIWHTIRSYTIPIHPQYQQKQNHVLHTQVLLAKYTVENYTKEDVCYFWTSFAEIRLDPQLEVGCIFRYITLHLT